MTSSGGEIAQWAYRTAGCRYNSHIGRLPGPGRVLRALVGSERIRMSRTMGMRVFRDPTSNALSVVLPRGVPDDEMSYLLALATALAASSMMEPFIVTNAIEIRIAAQMILMPPSALHHELARSGHDLVVIGAAFRTPPAIVSARIGHTIALATIARVAPFADDRVLSSRRQPTNH